VTSSVFELLRNARDADWQIRTDRLLFKRYERETFSGGVNLSAQARNREIDSKYYTNGRERTIWVSPRLLARIKGTRIT
jgi:hypothetical protein